MINNSEKIDKIFDNYFREIIKLNPETASYLGLTNEMGYDFDKDKLTDMSIPATDKEFELVKKYYLQMKNINKKNLTFSKKISAGIFETYLKNIIDSEKFRFHDYAINPMFGIHYNLTNLFTEYHSINDLEDAEDYISRLNQVPTRIDQLIENLEERKKRDIHPPKNIVERFRNILKDFISSESEENPFYNYFSGKLQDNPEIADSITIILNSDVKTAIETKIYPAYEKLIDFTDETDDIATEKCGVWKLPDGEEYYKYCLKKHTTTNLTADDIHNLGIQEVKRIQEKMTIVFDSLGFVDGNSFQEIETEYWNSFDNDDDHNFSYPRTEEGREQALKDYNSILKKVEKRLPEIFSLIPETPVIVKRIPKHKEAFLGQYYAIAPIDRSRPAAFNTNLSWLPFKPGMQTLLYHETVPGHHLQIAIAQENNDGYMFKQLTFFTGFIEGWALYAEKLAYENKWYEDVYSEIGYLGSELFRAVRLVVDTGIHQKKWTRDEAYNYMKANLGWGSYGEIDRYTVWPGQACAYKTGELKILKLREKAKTELGDQFDIKEFHKVILENGAVPLNLLEEIVDEYIKGRI